MGTSKILLTGLLLSITISSESYSQEARIFDRPVIGSLLEVDDTLFRMNNANQASLGAYGKVEGLTSILSKNRFVRDGYLQVDDQYEGRLVGINKKSWVKLKASGSAAVSDIEASAEANIAANKTMVATLLIVSPKSPDEEFFKLMDKYDNAGNDRRGKAFKKNLKNPLFRRIDSVIYAINLETGKAANIGVDAKFTASEKPVEVELKLGAENKLKLEGKQIIAYSYRQICWDGEEAESRIDFPGLTKNDPCKN